jgi:hypothetical protein
MEKNCSTIVKTCFNNIRKICYIRPYITDDACKTSINSLVTSRLDYGNSLMYGINKHLVNKLQKVQNTAARLITRYKKFDHETPVLKNLHWLPVEYRSQYKLPLFVYKALNNCAPNYLSDLFKIYSPLDLCVNRTHFSWMFQRLELLSTAVVDLITLPPHFGTLYPCVLNIPNRLCF